MRRNFGVLAPVNIQLPSFGISAFVSRHAGHFRMKTATNSYHELVLVVTGRGALQVGDDTVDLAAGAVVRIEPRIKHRFVDDPLAPLTLAVLCITETAAALLPFGAWASLERALPTGESRWLPSYSLLEMRHLLRQITLKCSAPQPHSSICVSGMVSQLLATILDEIQATAPTQASETFAATILWIDRHFTESIRVDDLADEVGVSYRAYTQQFRQATGQTVVNYVTRLRIQYAAQCLIATGDILDSALEAGFGDLSHFYRIFRRHIGVTPREFMLRQRAGVVSGTGDAAR